jgi:predicted O-methyltransferase YrrM
MLAVLAANRRRLVEVGTAIGYSTLWMGLALPPDGSIVTIDPDRERTDRARAFWRSAGLPDTRISVVNAPALEAFAGEHADLTGPFDMVFIDALKDEYLAYLTALMGRLQPGAIVVADNVLWSGRTSGSKPARPGDGTEALREFCARVSADPAFETTILPIGDGLLVATLRS